MATARTVPVRYILYVLVSASAGAAGINLTEILLRAYAVPAFGIAVSSNVAGGLFLLAVAALQGACGWRGWPATDWLRLLAAAAAAYALGFLLVYGAVNLAGSSTTTLLGRLEVLFVVGLAVLFLGERWTRRHSLAGTLALSGAVLVTFDPEALDLRFGAGEGMALLAAFVFAIGIILLKSLVDRQDGQLVTGYGLLLGAILLTPFAVADAETVAAAGAVDAWVGCVLVVRGVLLSISWVTYNVAMRHIGASRTAVLFLTIVVFTLLIQLGVDALAPGIGMRVPGSLLSALAGGLLIGVAVVLLHRQ